MSASEEPEPSWLVGWLAGWSTPAPDAGYDDEGLQQYPVVVFVLSLGLAAYLGFMPVFLAFGLVDTALQNLAISIGFLVALLAARGGRMGAAISYGVLAVVLHAVLNSARLGWAAGFHYQILLGALVQGLVAPFRLSIRAVTAFACAGAYVALAAVTYGSVSEVLSPEQQQMFATMNVVTFAVVLALIGLYYSEQVHRSRRERFEAQAALAAALGESRAIVDHMADGLLAVDAAGAVRAMNGSLQRLLGGTELPDALTGLVRDAMARGEILRGELGLEAGRIAAVVASPLSEGHGAVALVRDVTREKEVDRMKTEFTAVVSHELRTPLTSILGFNKMIQNRLEARILPGLTDDDPRTERAVRQVRENLGIIETEGRRLASLIDDVLDIAKMEAGSMQFASEPIHVAELVRRAESASSGLFVDRPVRLVVVVQGELPHVTGDASRLQQVLVNLVSNASKFTERGEVRIEARPHGDGVELRVVDTGPGIPASQHDAIFDRFHQVGGGLGDRPKGTGLGLPICKHIVESHGGAIHVEGAPGEGTAMVVRLPGGEAAESMAMQD